MDDEAWRTKNEWLRSVRGVHKGVITKLIKEADELMAAMPLTEEGRSCHKQFSLKVCSDLNLNNYIAHS